MAIYVGGQKWKLMLGGVAYRLGTFSSLSNISDIVLLSSDDYILMDSDGILLLPLPTGSFVIEGEPLATSEDYTLKDQNGYYLTLKESE